MILAKSSKAFIKRTAANIKVNGYEKFIKIADGWKMQYGKYK
jgi:hypothetical protein